ncbi:uncharacterized protein TRAVEDRAFT_126509 [Trametes versicolor FP-101664 SS1]|uniref:uncharacterized protein n=1 Tax=Trametes versicolor (strain FP-101664) TaxID=717944 RepID=UPI0004622EEB|nr:uncharacterized protein TRAVEDRAFT_126509 [Trametes versicolor FP-101664 SS1]EIW57823.1 hypothetical protein TRAVEDRAFT_126509 [Trametes versicolor FP-101664 SS1]
MAYVEPQPELPLGDYRRYGRQMILDRFGLEGQLKLQKASVVVVGAGGLGCPALQYLAAAGVGTIGVIDHDVVEISNLHRQVLHTEERVGMAKVLSAAEAVQHLNSRVQVNPITAALTPSNALELLAPYDLILDCTDNFPVRYLLSDTAVRLGKPLVSGAALQWEGQLCTYNLPLKGEQEGKRGPCYRCLFSKPPAPETSGTCEGMGVLGVVTGIIGNLQALEAIKILTGLHDGKPSLLMFSALGMPPFRSVKLRARKASCAGCGNEGERVGNIEETDYVAFCGGGRPDWLSRGLAEGDSQSRIRAKEFKHVLDASERPVRIVDVRPRTEFGVCHLPGSINVPINELVANPEASMGELGDAKGEADVYVICRLGNDSQMAVDALRNAGRAGLVKDLVGGLRAWSLDVDNNFPIY